MCPTLIKNERKARDYVESEAVVLAVETVEILKTTVKSIDPVEGAPSPTRILWKT